jgi:hypothetical protein
MDTQPVARDDPHAYQPTERPVIGKSIIVVSLVSAAVAGSWWIDFVLRDHAVTTLTIASATGHGVGLAIIPILVGLSRRKNALGQYAERRATAGAVILLLVLGVTGWNASEKVAAAGRPVVYRGSGCDITATFPGKPKISPVTIPGINVKGEQADLGIDEMYLRAECTPVSPHPFMEVGLRNILEEYASGNGLISPRYTLELSSDARPGITTGSVIGKKTIDGKLIIYEIQFAASSRSMLTLVAAGPADFYPTPSTREFLRSVQLFRQ